MLEAVLDCRGCVEASDVLMRHPEELAPVESHPVIVGESLGDVVRIKKSSRPFRIWRRLVESDSTFCASNASSTKDGSKSADRVQILAV